MKQILYHVTPVENVESILQNGLKRKGFAVYCSEKPYSWWKPGMAIFKVRVTGLKCDMSTFLPESDEVLIWGDVSPERLFLCKPIEVAPRRMYKNLHREKKGK